MLKTHDMKTSSRTQQEQYIVAIGASAGGLEAIHEFFDNMPNGTGISFVIIQHLSSDHKSLLVELVARHTHMQVFEAKDNVELNGNCVYVIPNNKLITVKGNKLKLEEKRGDKSPNNAVDVFFQSLAKEKKQRAIAVILSGTGSDGTRGIESVKRGGGVVLVQDPDSAKFNGMPNSAVQSGYVDHVLPVQEMPAEIIVHSKQQWLHSAEEEILDEAVLPRIFDLIHQVAGNDFHYYKTPTIVRRILRRMAKHNIGTAADYLRKLENDPEECMALGKDFLIGVTRFFRDKEAFELLKNKFIAPLLTDKEDGDTVKVWISACSTGEEAYSIGILLNEAAREQQKHLDIKLFASDLEEANIAIASKGAYPEAAFQEMDSTLRDTWFQRRENGFVVTPQLRKQVVFAKHNIISDAPFIKNDLVCCRNMLIYMNPALQQKVLSTLVYAVKSGGCVFLGPSENVGAMKKHLEDISEKWKIYRKTSETTFNSQHLSFIAAQAPKDIPRREDKQPAAARQPVLQEEVFRLLSEEIKTVSFFLDDQFNIAETLGDYGQFLSMPRNSLNLNLLRMVPSEVSFLISTETRKAIREKKKIVIAPFHFNRNGQPLLWKIVIKPVAAQVLITIIEQEIQDTEGHVPPPLVLNEGFADNYALALENELSEARKTLQETVENLETANEELQSSNEELLSANEELQSSNEELQSLNEELHTLNAEHQLKIKELIELNDDLDNYFRSTDIAQIFLDQQLNIRKFNPAALQVVNLIEADNGRPFTHISHNIRYDKLNSDLDDVLRNNSLVEKEIALQNGKQMLMRIMPYLRHDKKNGGLILSFVDITAITHLNNIVKGVFNSSRSAILAFKSVRDNQHVITDFQLLTANDSAHKMLHSNADTKAPQLLNKHFPLLQENGLFQQLRKVVQEDTFWHGDVFAASKQKWYEITAVKMMDGFVVSIADISTKKSAEQKLKQHYTELIATKDKLKQANNELESKVAERTRALSESEERFRLVARATNDALWDWNLVTNENWWNETFYTKFGFTPSEEHTTRKSWTERIHPADRSAVESGIMSAINSNQPQWTQEYRFRKENGEYANILDRGYILHDEQGTPFRMLGSMFDITEIKKAEQKIAGMNEELERKVKERTRDLRVLNQALEISNNDLQQFASVASHDLQEPLRKIQMFANMLQDEFRNNLNARFSNYLDKIIISSDRMKALIQDILSYSRLSAGNDAFQLSDVNDIITGILDDFELSIKEKSATVEISPLPKLEIIPGQIRQVFHNLISNALKFIHPKRPPVISITSEHIENKSFDAPSSPDGKFIKIIFKDNGIGFDLHSAGNIFNLFHRLHSKDKFEGTGIGLAVAKKIVEKHNGLITVHSIENEGTTFTIVLPCKQQLID